ncbi:MAG: (2Fe-2S) ferredoxin domain-containing protein [Pseudomonadota bacterium]|nr:(2Fe-2S) ferredoxin domain-containing protein [Pseudomonadota bacterium]
MQRVVKSPYALRQVLVCTNLRDPSTGKPSCGMNGGVAFREHLKKAVKERGLKGQVMITGTSCMDFCPAQGCVVAFYPENEWRIVDPTPEEEEAVLQRAIRGPEEG